MAAIRLLRSKCGNRNNADRGGPAEPPHARDRATVRKRGYHSPDHADGDSRQRRRRRLFRRTSGGSGHGRDFIARGAHLAALRERGLRIESPEGNHQVARVQATDDPTTIGPVDIVFFTVKLYDTESALPLLPPLIGPDTLVVPFQNGVDSVEVLTRAVGRRTWPAARHTSPPSSPNRA